MGYLLYKKGLDKSIVKERLMPLITISLWPGRTQEQKEALAKAITDAVNKVLGAKREHVIIVYQDTPRESWYIAGDKL
ncbi:MAG: 4-oxalocrotonate tautomerase family protein, partial [Candidatus Nitrosocaldaceae archaeon]